jgi:hypothetical protein
MQERHTINASYYCSHGRGDVIYVYNTGAYLIAEFHEQSGQLRWQRVVPAEQKKAIESWLNQHFRNTPREAKPKTSTAHA